MGSFILDADHVLREPDVFVIYFARLLQQQGSRTVLDWDCGAGRHVVYLAQEGFEVTGIDRSPTAIKIAENWLKGEGLNAALRPPSTGVIYWSWNMLEQDPQKKEIIRAAI